MTAAAAEAAADQPTAVDQPTASTTRPSRAATVAAVALARPLARAHGGGAPNFELAVAKDGGALPSDPTEGAVERVGRRCGLKYYLRETQKKN